MVFLGAVIILTFTNAAVCFINNNRSEYIIDVTPSCPSSPNSGDAIFKLLADIPAYAAATCRGNHTFDFQGVGDGITFTLAIGFNPALVEHQCIFQKKEGSEIYVVLIEVGWGEPDGFILTHKEQYQVSCAYGDKGQGDTGGQPVDDWLIAPEEIQYMIGDVSNSSFELRVIDVRGDPFFSSLPFGRWVQLEALSDGVGGEQGLRALSCTARNEFTSYSFLRAGCGDGIVLEKNAGFQSRGMRVFSPYFEGFRLRGSDRLSFVCNFTLCDTNCDGNSCPVETKRRADPIPRGLVLEIEGGITDVSDAPELDLIDGDRLVLEPETIRPPSAPPILLGRTHNTKRPGKPRTHHSTNRPPLITWVIAVLVAVVVLLVFSTILQICIHVKSKDTYSILPVHTTASRKNEKLEKPVEF